MGECTDFHVGERVLAVFEIDTLKTTVGIESEVSWVWETHIDVKAGDHVFRVQRSWFDCQDLEVGGKCSFLPSMADEAIELKHYDPEDEASQHE